MWKCWFIFNLEKCLLEIKVCVNHRKSTFFRITNLDFRDKMKLVIKLKEKTILVIFTGGTISMVKNGNQGMTIGDNLEDLIDVMQRELPNIDILSYTFSLKPSPFITPSDMFELAKLVDIKLHDAHIDGVVITHGTDTLEETAFFLDLYLEHTKPVVITGSMRGFKEIAYDGLSNLRSSLLVAANQESRNKGVLVCLNDAINTAREVTKTHTLSLDTFKSLEFGPIGIVELDSVIYSRIPPRETPQIHPNHIEERVSLIKTVAGENSDILNLLIDHGVKGIVIEALGRGNVTPQMIPGIKRAIALNIPIVLTSRAPIGRVLDNYGYEGGGHQLKELGAIFTKGLNGQKARIQLILALGETNSMERIKGLFD